MKLRLLSLQLVLRTLITPLAAATLENHALRLEADSSTGALAVTLKQTGRQWNTRSDNAFTAKTPLTLADQKIVGALKQNDGTVFGVELALDDLAGVIVRIQPDTDSPAHDISYPPAFRPESSEEIAIPHQEGTLVPVNGGKEFHKFFSRGLHLYEMIGTTMAWAGVADLAGKGDGYAIIVRTPYDAKFTVDSVDNLLAPQLAWEPSKGALGYEREALLRFFTRGGYVAMAAAYREELRSQGTLVSLREKMKSNLRIDRLIGGPQVWLWSDGVSLDVVRELHKAGIKGGFLCLSVNELTQEILDGLGDQWFAELDRMGYLAGVYDSVSSMHDPNRASWGTARFPPQYWPDSGIMLKDGKRQLGFREMGQRVCTIIGNEVAAARFEEKAGKWPAMSALFLDVDTTLAPMECYDPEHPMTRLEDIDWRMKRNNLAARTHGWVVAGENGNDWALPTICAAQGAMTLSNFYRDTRDEKSPYFAGDFNDPSGQLRPPIMLRQTDAPPVYIEHGLNPANRAPLYELAAHDCIVQTWRWNDNTFKLKGYDRRKELLSILYGTVPMWNIDKPTWERDKMKFLASYKDVCRWHRQIGLEPMTAHGFLSPDRMVQYSTFGNGRAVLVNFSDKPWSKDGLTMEPQGFRTFDTAPEWMP